MSANLVDGLERVNLVTHWVYQPSHPRHSFAPSCMQLRTSPGVFLFCWFAQILVVFFPFWKMTRFSVPFLCWTSSLAGSSHWPLLSQKYKVGARPSRSRFWDASESEASSQMASRTRHVRDWRRMWRSEENVKCFYFLHVLSNDVPSTKYMLLTYSPT